MRYPERPTAPPFGSSSADTPCHVTMSDVSDGVTATVSGASGAVVSAPALVSTRDKRHGCHALAVSDIFAAIVAESAEPNQLRPVVWASPPRLISSHVLPVMLFF